MPRYPRAYLLTVNNWTEDDLCSVLGLIDNCVYSIIGFEIGHKCGNPHFHAYAYWQNGKAWSSIKKAVPRARLDVCKGTPEQNRTYCAKEGNFEEFGQLPKKGERTDLQQFKDDIINGMSEEDLLDVHTEYMARYDRFYQRCKNLELKKKSINMNAPEVIVITGEPGIGKTRHVYDNNDINDIYKLEVGDGSSGSIFWDGYLGEPIILIDDFHSNIKLDYMLRLLDRYPMKLNIKGGYTYRVSTKIYITSNIPIDKWYPNCPDVHRKALFRRITNQMDLHDQTTHNSTLNV